MMTEYKGNTILFSPTAIRQIQKLRSTESNDSVLRIGYEKGGCSGYQYIFKFDQSNENDHIETIEGFDIAIDRSNIDALRGLKIDYESGLSNRGFIYTNPNAQSTCGCGTSFN